MAHREPVSESAIPEYEKRHAFVRHFLSKTGKPVDLMNEELDGNCCTLMNRSDSVLLLLQFLQWKPVSSTHTEERGSPADA